MKDIKNILRLALVVMLAGTGSVMADPPVYENFKGKVLNSGRWFGGRVDIGVVELRRKIQDSAIRLRVRGIADTDVTSGDRNKVINRIWIDAVRAPSIRSFQTYVQANEAVVADCDDTGAADSRSGYQNLNVWFNTGESTGSENRLGDVYTQLGLRKSNDTDASADQLDIVAYIGRCADTNCDTSENLLEQTLDVYPMGSKVVLRTTWDDTKKELRFYTRKQGVEPIALTYDYAAVVADGGNTGTPNSRLHGIQVRSDAAECNMAETSGERPYGLIDVQVYNARISDAPDGF